MLPAGGVAELCIGPPTAAPEHPRYAGKPLLLILREMLTGNSAVSFISQWWQQLLLFTDKIKKAEHALT